MRALEKSSYASLPFVVYELQRLSSLPARCFKAASGVRASLEKARVPRRVVMTRVHRPALRGIVFAAAMSVAATVFAQGLITAVPPAAFRPPTTEKAAVATMLLPQATPALRITLPEPTAVERATLRDRNAPREANATRRPSRKDSPLHSRATFRPARKSSRCRACTGKRWPMAAAPRGLPSYPRVPQRCVSRLRCRRARPASCCDSAAMG